MPAFLTAELAEAAIGLCVVEKQEGGGAGSSGWVCPARLLRVVNQDEAIVQPNGHHKEEIAKISKLRLWMKGNHQLGEHAMQRAESINAVAMLKEQVAGFKIKTVTLADAQAWLGNGVNPLVMFRLFRKSKDAMLGRLVGVRGDMIVVQPCVGDAAPQDLEVGCVGVPADVELDQFDYNLLAKVFKPVMSGMNKAEPAKLIQAELPPPVGNPPPVLRIIPQQALHAVPPPPVVEPAIVRPEGEGEWVIVDRKARTFWQSADGTPAGTWVKEIGKARVYDKSKGVNGAASRMKQEGIDPEPMSLKQAQFFYDLWYRPSRLAAVEAEAQRMAKPEPAPALHASGDGAMTSARDRVAAAVRERVALEVMLHEAKAKEAQARGDLEIELLGEA